MKYLRRIGIFARRHLHAFQLFGYTGFLLSFVQSMLLVRHLGLSGLTLLGLTGMVILTFYVLMMITKILANGEVIIYYHHEIAVIASSALFLRLTHQPALPYLDILVLGLGLFLAFGRIGCLIVGCCHGRPSKWGVTYREDHVDAGFPAYLAGIQLFPIQAVESATALCIVAGGLALLLRGSTPGSVFEFYVLCYGCARFCLEFFRGDSDRRYLWGFSEAQWTSLLLASAVVVAERTRLLPPSTWHWAAFLVMVAAIAGIRIARRFDPARRFELLHPRHVREVIRALDHLRNCHRHDSLDPARGISMVLIHVAETSLGYRISGGYKEMPDRIVKHYSISSDGAPLTHKSAYVFSRLLARLEAEYYAPKPVPGRAGVFHIIFDASLAHAEIPLSQLRTKESTV